MKTKTNPAERQGTAGMGLWPDVLVCRRNMRSPEEMKAKIAMFCNVPVNHVLQNLDVEYLYEAPLAMEKEHLAQVVCESLQLPLPGTGSDRLETDGRRSEKPIHEVEIDNGRKNTSSCMMPTWCGRSAETRRNRSPCKRKDPLGRFEEITPEM